MGHIFKKGESGQTLVGILSSIAISGVMMLAFMEMSNMNMRSSQEFQKSTSRTLFEMQLAGSLANQSLCSCNFVGRAVPVGGTLQMRSLSTDVAACPTPAIARRDLLNLDQNALGFALGGGLFVNSVRVQNVSPLGGTQYVAELNVQYRENSGVEMRDRNFFFYFDRDTVNPLSTPTNPIIRDCSVATSPKAPVVPPPPPEPAVGSHLGYCIEDGQWSRDMPFNAERRGVARPGSIRSPSTTAVRFTEGYRYENACACPAGYELQRAFYRDTREIERRGGGVIATVFETGFTCLKR